MNNCSECESYYVIYAIVNEKREDDPLYSPFLEGIDIDDKDYMLYSCRQRIEYINANLGRYDDWY